MPLTNIIKEHIKKDGPISFRDFMELSLYHPEHGYYTSFSTPDKIGKNGDYFTSSTLTPVFGTMIGKQIEEMWNILGEEEFTIVKYGAGTGLLCRAILDYFKPNKKLFEKLRYCIIEKSPAMREKAKSHLSEKVHWHDSIHDIPALIGCVLSNELVDNFSVHRVVMKDELMEVYVDYTNEFTEVLKPASKNLTEYLNELKVELPKEFCTEINLEATHWLKEISKALKKGYVITIDYGHPSCELYSEYRSSGTLVC